MHKRENPPGRRQPQLEKHKIRCFSGAALRLYGLRALLWENAFEIIFFRNLSKLLNQ
jgi:hypothetical protein